MFLLSLQTTTMAKFLGSYSDPNGLNHLANSDKLLLAKQYYLHAEVLQLINSSPGGEGVVPPSSQARRYVHSDPPPLS